MWQVVTASQLQEQTQWLNAFAEVEQGVMRSEIDGLLAVLAAFTPRPTSLARRSTPPPHNLPAQMAQIPGSAAPPKLLYFAQKTALPVNGEVIDVLEIPRVANAPAEPPIARELREQLLKLRTTILLAVEQRQLRSVLLCGADPAAPAASIAAQLSKLLAEYERFKVAYIEVEGEPSPQQRKVLPFGYTFQIRQTKTANRCEIASSLGAIRLTDWLKWWSPTVALQELGKRFDLVVISAPSITAHSDVALLAGAVDGVILTATEHVTTYASLAEAQQRLHAAQAHILGVTLHQASTTATPASVKARLRSLLKTVVKSK